MPIKSQTNLYDRVWHPVTLPKRPAFWRRRLQKWLYKYGLADCPFLLDDQIEIPETGGKRYGYKGPGFIREIKIDRHLPGSKRDFLMISVTVQWLRGDPTSKCGAHWDGYIYMLDELYAPVRQRAKTLPFLLMYKSKRLEP